MKLKVKIIPNASSTSCSGWMGDVLKIKVKEIPEKGKANKAVLNFLSSLLKCPLRDVEIISGHTNTIKTIEIQHLDEKEIRKRLNL